MSPPIRSAGRARCPTSRGEQSAADRPVMSEDALRIACKRLAPARPPGCRTALIVKAVSAAPDGDDAA